MLLVAEGRCLIGNGCYCSRSIWRKVTCMLARVLACGSGMLRDGKTELLPFLCAFDYSLPLTADPSHLNMALRLPSLPGSLFLSQRKRKRSTHLKDRSWSFLEL